VRVVRTGITRTVILVGRYAIKVPSFRGHVHGDMRGRIAGFCQGVIANQAEYLWRDFEAWRGQVAPVLHSWFWGLIQIYPRCQSAPDGAELFELEPCPGDLKPENFGLLDGRLVRVDYAI
jgi:hypothetical protein